MHTTPERVAAVDDRTFFTQMSLAALAVVFVGFAASYFLWPIIRSTHDLAGRAISPSSPLIVHLHAAAFTAWMLLLVAQARLVAVGRTDIHRRIDAVAVWLVPLLVITALMTAVRGARDGWNPAGPPGGPFVDALSFMAVPVGDVVVFVALVAAGLVLRRRREIHKRLMLLATVGALLPPATSRMGPVGLVVFAVLLFAPAARDFWCRARARWLSLFVALGILASIPVRTLVGMSGPWHAFAAWLVG
jgi:hypothetical protein